MTLITCIECKAQVSDQAKSCPQCGARKFKPRPEKAKTHWKLIGVAFLVIMALGHFASEQGKEKQAAIEAAKSPEQRAKEAKAKSAELEQMTLTGNAVRLLKASMKDPTSFNLTDAYGGANGAGCISYRAKNSFAAIVPGSAVILKGGKILVEATDGNRFVTAWNKLCANGGPDFKQVIGLIPY